MRRYTNQLLLVLMCALATIGGCAKPAGQVFPPLEKPIVWPASPERARIRYVGELRTDADLKPAVSFFKGVGNALFGEEPIQAMLTPFAVCTDGGDRIFVADSGAQVVHVFDIGTRRYEKWHPEKDGQRFAQPVGVAWNSIAHQLFVADSVAGSVYVFDSRGRFLGPLPINVPLKRPCGLAYEATRNRLFITDPRARLRQFRRGLRSERRRNPAFHHDVYWCARDTSRRV